MQTDQPPLTPQMQQIEGSANEPESPYQAITNMIEMIANYIEQHKNEPNILQFFADELRYNSGILANSAIKKEDTPEGGRYPFGLTEILGPQPASAYARREHPSADEVSVRESLKRQEEQRKINEANQEQFNKRRVQQQFQDKERTEGLKSGSAPMQGELTQEEKDKKEQQWQ